MVARLALKNNCPILPLALNGTQKISSHFPRRAEVNIRFDELVYPLPDETALNLTDRYMFRLAELLPPDFSCPEITSILPFEPMRVSSSLHKHSTLRWTLYIRDYD